MSDHEPEDDTNPQPLVEPEQNGIAVPQLQPIVQQQLNHRAMEKALKPERLDLDASSPNASKQWKHWRRTFENFLEEVAEGSGRQPNKLRTLINYVSHTVYEYIDELEDYDECIMKLEELYCKTPNEIFARHCLATRRQESTESIEEYLVALQKLSKDCNFKAVSADVYRKEMVRDSFIRGLNSSYIRQRLLENKTLSKEEAYIQALSLHDAQKNSNLYSNGSVSQVAAVQPNESMNQTTAAMGSSKTNQRNVKDIQNGRFFFLWVANP